MRIRRITVTLPARLAPVAEHEARRIAQAAAEQLSGAAPKTLRVELDGRGASGHGLAAMVGHGIASAGKGRG